MAQVRVLQTSFINNSLRQEGDIVDDYEGEVGPNLELVEEEAATSKKGKKAAAADVEA